MVSDAEIEPRPQPCHGRRIAQLLLVSAAPEPFSASRVDCVVASKGLSRDRCVHEVDHGENLVGAELAVATFDYDEIVRPDDADREV